MSHEISLRGIRTHNLKNINASFPLEALSVVTGVSGSGKSSLVFDTLYGESYCRYIESLSSYARLYLSAIPRPVIDKVDALPASLAIRQNRGTKNPRSTVGTMSEVSDLLRLLFGHAGIPSCKNGHGEIYRDRSQSVAKKILAKARNASIILAAPLRAFEKMDMVQLKKQLEIQGFVRVVKEGKVSRISHVAPKGLSSYSIVVDRVTVIDEELDRVQTSLDLCFKVGRGCAQVLIPPGPSEFFYSKLICRSCGLLGVTPKPVLFNHNHPAGACPKCQGFGRVPIIDLKKIVPNRGLSLAEGGVKCWHFGRHTRYLQKALQAAKDAHIDADKPFSDFDDDEWHWLEKGRAGFKGLEGYFAYLDRKKYKPHYRMHAARYRSYVTCNQCQGNRLNEAASLVKWQGFSFSDLDSMPIAELLALIQGSSAVGKGEKNHAAKGVNLEEAIDELLVRLNYLCDVGLSYLNVGRQSMSLSGGELNRIQMARCLGNNLTGTLFCLDEPSSGLHAQDTIRLKKVIDKIKQQGNTIVMVEHEAALIAAADRVIEMGPLAGAQGGEIVYQGAPKPPLKFPQRSKDPTIDPLNHPFLALKGANTHNLKNITVKFPLGALSCVCGVSGSGKSSLVRHTLYPRLEKGLLESADFAKEDLEAFPAEVLAKISRVLLVSQDGLQRSSRSNIGTYLGIFPEVRKLFASVPKAQGLGLKSGHFSFNIPGGRCEDCKGMGEVMEDLSFLGEVSVICATCQGRRFSDKVLQVSYRKRHFLEILNLTILEAREVFFDSPALVKILDEIIGIGLGYLTLGQPTSLFSGGEAQRLKLLSLLKEIKKGGSYFLIIDEPTTGLSDQDVVVLLNQLQNLTKKGHTVVVVEHHLGVIKSADWLIEVGPEAGDLGGNLVYMGPPDGLTQVAESPTARFLKL